MNKFLLPYHFKWIGVVLVIIGLAGLVFYLWFDFRLMAPVFAVISSYFETKIFTVFRTNIAGDLIMLSILTGFYFLCFSKEKSESEILDQLRMNAFSKAIVANTGLLIFSILFTYGTGFLVMLLLNLCSLFIFYLIFLYFLKRKERKNSNLYPHPYEFGNKGYETKGKPMDSNSATDL